VGRAKKKTPESGKGTVLGGAIGSELYRHVIDSLTSGVIALDKDGIIITANRAACVHLNADAATLRPGKRLETIPYAEQFVDVMRHMISTREPMTRHEIMLTQEDGSRKEIGLSASLLGGKDEFAGVIFLFTDMTERRRLERTAELNRQLASIGELTAGVVHELRSPLTVLSGTTQLLLRKLDSNDPCRRLAENMYRETLKLEKLISQFLGFAKPFELEVALCRPESVAARAVELCGLRAQNKGVALHQSCAPDLPEIQADADKAAQALANILNNAIDAVSEGGETALRVYRDGDVIVFEISDNGPGIHLGPDEDLFTPFLTKKKDGTGLGLAIVHRIVIAHRGSVSYSNRIEGGAQFDVRLPIERAAPTNAVGGGTD